MRGGLRRKHAAGADRALEHIRRLGRAARRLHRPYGTRLTVTALFTLAAVTVVPNAGMILGEVIEVLQTTEKGTPSIIKVRIISSEGVGHLPNFTKDKVGRNLDLHTKDKLPTLKKGDIITARVRYMGNERLSLFWATDISLVAK